MSRMSHRYPQELKDRAVRLVAESREDLESEWTAIESVAKKLGIGSSETLRKWIRKAEVDAGQRPGVTTQDAAEVRKLRAEVRELRRANEILMDAAGSSRPSSPGHRGSCGVHRLMRGPRDGRWAALGGRADLMRSQAARGGDSLSRSERQLFLVQTGAHGAPLGDLAASR